MSKSKLVVYEFYRGYKYYIEYVYDTELYFWYFANEYLSSVGYSSQDLANSAAKDCIDNLIIEIEEE